MEFLLNQKYLIIFRHQVNLLARLPSRGSHTVFKESTSTVNYNFLHVSMASPYGSEEGTIWWLLI